MGRDGYRFPRHAGFRRANKAFRADYRDIYQKVNQIRPVLKVIDVGAMADPQYSQNHREDPKREKRLSNRRVARAFKHRNQLYASQGTI